MERSGSTGKGCRLVKRRRCFFFELCEAFCSSLFQRLGHRFPQYFHADQERPGRRRIGQVEAPPLKYTVNMIQDIESAWVKLKMAVISPGLNYTELNKLDIFEFFAVLEEVQAKNKPKA